MDSRRLQSAIAAFLFALAAATFGSPALAADPPANVNDFTTFASKMVAQTIPNASVSVSGPLRLSVLAPGRTAPSEISLNRIWAFCEKNRTQCGDALTDFVRTISPSMIDESDAPARANLRAAVRPVGYVEQLRAALKQKPTTALEEPIAAPLVADLWVICLLDSSRTARTIQYADLTKLGVSKDEAIAIATANTLKILGSMTFVAQTLKKGSIGYLPGDYYESSRLLAHQQWGKYAKAIKGQLIVAVPANNIVIYGNGVDADAIGAIRRMVREAALGAERPLSLDLFKWTPEGWKPLPR